MRIVGLSRDLWGAALRRRATGVGNWRAKVDRIIPLPLAAAWIQCVVRLLAFMAICICATK